jgi:hypothetical protein
MSPQPLSERIGFSSIKQGDRSMGHQIDENRAIRVPFAQRLVIDADHGWRE